MFKKLKRAALGARVPHEKGTAAMATEKMPVPAKVIFPMVQHIGKPCVPVVKKGDTVQVGTLVGKAPEGISASIYSSVSGTVQALDTYRMSNGMSCPAVVIETDGQQTPDPACKAPEVADKESFVKAVADSGLVGLGGAGFPTWVKLSPSTPVDTLLINAAECEPYLTSDTRELLENSDTVMSGIRAVMKYLELKTCIIGIERNKPECIDKMETLVKGVEGVSVKALPSRYPQGAEKILIESLTGREVPQGGLPAQAGVIVLNAATVSGIGRYLADGMPLVTRRVTVDGDAVKNPKNVEVPIGTPIQDVLDFCGLKEDVQLGKVIMGGPMMGVAVADLSGPILRQNNGILAFSAQKAQLPQAQACIRCGRCIEACPMGLSPVEIAGAFKKGDAQQLGKLNIDLCMLCGSCSYVCPAKRPVTQTMRLAKDFAMKEARK